MKDSQKSDINQDPMEEIDEVSLPMFERDMSDVEAEITAALSQHDLGRLMGLCPNQVLELENKGILFSLTRDGHSVYPRWQFDELGKPISLFKEILEILSTISTDPVDLLILMITGLDFFAGESIKDYIISEDWESALMEARVIAKM